MAGRSSEHDDREHQREHEHESHPIHEGQFRPYALSATDSANGADGRCQCAGFVGAFPEQSEQEDHHDAGREESGVLLDVLECLIEAAEQAGAP